MVGWFGFSARIGLKRMGEGSFLQILKKECDGQKSCGEGLVIKAQQNLFVLKSFEYVVDLI